MPHKGNGNGFGWQWRYVAFTLEEETTIAINEKFNDNSVKAEDLTDVEEYYFAAVKAQTTPNTDWTGLINNNSFEEGNINGWTNSGSVALGALNTSPANNPKVGNWFVEKWDTAGSVDFNQTISDLPAGYYKVTVRARNEADAVAYLYANDEKVAFVKNTTDTYSTNVVIANTGALKIGVSCENHPEKTWLAVDHFTLTYLGPVANMTITDAQWGTFYAPFDVALPEGAFAYTIIVEDNKTVRNKVAEGGETIHANTAVLVYCAEIINQNFVGVPTDEMPVGLENALVGTLEPIASGDVPDDAYYLAKKNDVLNFYPAGQAKLAANRAYLVFPAGAKIEGLFEGEVTGINEVNSKNADSILRNIQGMPVNKGYKGIVIMDGKKY